MTKRMKKTVKTLAQFKKFLAENCWHGESYLNGKYDREIFNWFKK